MTQAHDVLKVAAYMPAVGGFYVLSVTTKDDGYPCGFVAYPVIGWAIEKDTHYPWAISLQGEDNTLPAVLQPDGSVETALIGRHENVTEWLKGEQRNFERYQQRQLEKNTKTAERKTAINGGTL